MRSWKKTKTFFRRKISVVNLNRYSRRKSILFLKHFLKSNCYLLNYSSLQATLCSLSFRVYVFHGFETKPTIIALTRIENLVYFISFNPADLLKLLQETNSKIFGGCSTARKVYAHNDMLH